MAAINRAVEGVKGVTAVHLCFGYGSMVKNKPSGYSFLPELEATTIDQVSIETAQSKLDCAILARLPTKQIILGVLDLQDLTVETPATVAERIRRALPYVSPDRHHRGAGLRAQVSAAGRGVCEDEGDGRGRGDRPPRTCSITAHI